MAALFVGLLHHIAEVSADQNRGLIDLSFCCFSFILGFRTLKHYFLWWPTYLPQQKRFHDSCFFRTTNILSKVLCVSHLYKILGKIIWSFIKLIIFRLRPDLSKDIWAMWVDFKGKKHSKQLRKHELVLSPKFKDCHKLLTSAAAIRTADLFFWYRTGSKISLLKSQQPLCPLGSFITQIYFHMQNWVNKSNIRISLIC